MRTVPCVKIPNGPEQTADYKSGQTERTELAGTLTGIVPSPKKRHNSLTAHSTDQQPFLAIAQQISLNGAARLEGLRTYFERLNDVNFHAIPLLVRKEGSWK